MQILPQKHTSKKELTERQKSFVEALFDNQGNISKAMKQAGYTPGSRAWLVSSVANEVIERTQKYLATHGVKAAQSIINALDSYGTTPKGELRLKAAESLLNRIGIGSRETVDHNVTALHGVVLLPNKKEEVVLEGDN